MGKYLIAKEFWFDAGHRMYGHDLLKDRGAQLLKGKESILGWQRYKDIHPHGHTFRVKIFLESMNLDAQYMIVDTDKVKRVIKEFMDIYDHAFLIGRDDPIKDKFLDLFKGCRIVVMDSVPTAETIVEEIFNFFDKRFRALLDKEEYPRKFKIAEIQLHTASTAMAIYKPGYNNIKGDE